MSESINKKAKTIVNEIVSELENGTAPDDLKQLYSSNLVESALEINESKAIAAKSNEFVLLATRDNTLETLLEMLENGISPNVVHEIHKSTALMYAAQCNNLEIVKVLLGARPTCANPNIQNKYGYTALFYTVCSGNLEIVDALLEAGTNYDLQADDGDTALHLASNNGQFEIVKSLLKAGANPFLLNSENDTAYDCIGVDENSTACQQILREGMYKWIKKKKQMRGLMTVGTTPKGYLPVLPKDIWRLISTRVIYLEICDENNNTIFDDLLIMAEVEFGVDIFTIEEWRKEKTETDLCKIISGFLSIGVTKYSEKALNYLAKREKLQQGADIGLKFREFLQSVGIAEEQRTLTQLFEKVAMMQRPPSV